MFPRIHISIERWRKNTEYGVWVSNKGRVRLIKNKTYLEPRINGKGYCIYFTERGAIMAHRLVAYTWMGGKRSEEYTIDHINSNKRDNRVSNLRWVTEEVNKAYASFIICDNQLEEPKLRPSIEEEEVLWATINNNSVDENARGQALIKLLESNLIKLRADAIEVTDKGVLNDLHNKLANGTDLEKFAGRVVKVVNKYKCYCNHFWFLEKKDA